MLRGPALVCVFFVAACEIGAPSAAPPTPPPASYRALPPDHRGGTAVFSDWEFPSGFDVLSAGTESDLRAGSLVFAPLWGFDSGLNAYPELAREVPTVANGDVKLRPELEWSDGQPLTAEDVVFTWQAIKDSATAAAAPQGFDRITSMDVKSDTELVWNFDQIYASYLQLGPVMWVMPRHRLESKPHSSWSADPFFSKPDAVSGPFEPVEVVPDDRISFVPNPRFAGHAPYVDKLVFKAYGGRDAMLQGLKAGETDVGFHLSAADIADLNALDSSHTSITSSLRQEFLNPNHGVNTATGKPPPWVTPAGEDTQVLRALSLAIDRSAMVGSALGGAGKPSRGLFPSLLKSYADSALPGGGKADAAGAQKMLSDDGWVPGSDGVRVKSGRRLEFTLLSVCDSAEAGKEQQILKDEWGALGAAVKTDCRKRAPFFASFADGGVNATGAFDMSVYSYTWPPDPGAWALLGASGEIPGSGAPAGQNWDRCRDAELDSDLEAGESTLDVSKRHAAYSAVAERWVAYECTIPLFEWPDVVQVSNRLKNFAPNPTIQTDLWNAADWWLS